MIKFGFKSWKKGITPRELRKKHGTLTTINSTPEQLLEGINRQWKRYNDPEFQKQEFYERREKIFKNR